MDGKNMLTKSTVCVWVCVSACEFVPAIQGNDLFYPYAPSAFQTFLLVAVEEKPSQFCTDECQQSRGIPATSSLTIMRFTQVHSVALLSSLRWADPASWKMKVWVEPEQPTSK